MSLEERRKHKKFRLFVSKWLYAGYQHPDWVEGWKFGHDWNGDYSLKRHYNDEGKYDSKADSFGTISSPMKDGLQELSAAMILSGRIGGNVKIEQVCEWIEENLTITPPRSIHTNDKFLGYLCYAMYNMFKEIESASD